MYPSQNRLVRKQVALATIREIQRPEAHIGLSIAPFLDVDSDDVIFDYTRGLSEGMVPARAEDAESELAQKDVVYGGTGSASIIDWAQKHHYTASDVQRYNENLMVQAALQGVNSVRLPTTVEPALAKFRRMLARDEARRRRDLDNRIEWLIMTAMATGGISYNDGKIKFSVDFGRPPGQHEEAPVGALYAGTTHDPIGDIKSVVEFMEDTHGVVIDRAITSRRVLSTFVNSDRFVARSGLVVGGVPSSPIDPNYLPGSFNEDAAVRAVEAATGVTMRRYDGFYRSRNIASTTFANVRFFPDDVILFLPSQASMDEVDDDLGFGRTLTSPHPEGNFETGFYEWEKSDVDPWGVDRGTGVKAFPVFPHMNLTFTMKVFV